MMDDKILTVLSMNWAPMISMTVIILSATVSGICWLIKRMDQQAARTDRLYEMFVEQNKEQAARSKEQAARTDKLYEMFVNLLKEGKK